MKALKDPEFRPEVESAFKKIKQVMSWIVGIAAVAILVLPQFNEPVLDQVTKVLFLAGFIDLLIFIVIEFIGNEVKTMLDKLIHE